MPVLAMLLAVVLWSSSLVGSKAAVMHMSIGEVVGGRFMLAAAVMWAMVLITRQPVKLREAPRPLMMGMMDPGLVSVLMVWAMHHTSAINVAMFWALMPLIMPIAGRIVLREAINPNVMFGAVLAFAGALLLVQANQASGEGDLFGDFLAICGVLAAVGTSLIGRRVAQTQGRPMVTTAWQMTMSLGIGLLALNFLQGPAAPMETLDTDIVILMLYLGGIATAGPFFLLNFSLSRLPVARTSLFASLVGPLSVPMAAFFLGETIQILEIAAIAIVMLGVAVPTLLGPHVLGRLQKAPDDRLLCDQTFVAFDTETTGLEPSTGDRIVQIAGVRIAGGVIQRDQIFNELVNPGRAIPPFSTTFHGITDAQVSNSRAIGPVLQDFHAFCGDGILVAHNAAFDMKFLELAVKDGAPVFNQTVLDTLLLSAVLEPGAREHDLDALAIRHGVVLPEADRHTALGDSLATGEVFLALLSLAERSKTVGDLLSLSKKARHFRRLQKHY